MKALSSAPSGLLLKATSIYGEGDKIALPPSVLEILTQSLISQTDHNEASQQQQPWTFRIGILNPEYSFPASSVLQNLPLSMEDGDGSLEFDDDDDYDDDNLQNTAAYLDELSHKYLAYTHGTVVEFTQDEGYVGLPEPIAQALLRQATTAIPVTRTKDKAAAVATNGNDDGDILMRTDGMDDNDNDGEKTPGHLAWGAFDIPDVDIEISLVRLPKGRTAQLRPTTDAIAHGFYELNNVKLVLEQSLIRTRATLSVGDMIHTWHRGIKFDLTVTAVSPLSYRSVSCINTDIEIDFEAPATTATTKRNDSSNSKETGHVLSAPMQSGRRLMDESPPLLRPLAEHSPPTPTDLLLPEPPLEQHEGVVTVLIRAANGARGQRRFDIATATIQDLFAFATSLLMVASHENDDAVIDGSFQLVTRFPRRVWNVTSDGAVSKLDTLEQAGIAAGQELFLVEKL